MRVPRAERDRGGDERLLPTPTGLAPDEPREVAATLLAAGSLRGFACRELLPAAVLTAGLLAGQVSLARSQSREFVRANFVRFLRAKGLLEGAVLRRVLYNAAVPIASLAITELLAVLLLDVMVVEYVFGIEGFGHLLFDAVEENDVPLMLGLTMVVAFVGVGGTLLQDAVVAALDPRIRCE